LPLIPEPGLVVFFDATNKPAKEATSPGWWQIMDLHLPSESQFSYEFCNFMERLSRNDSSVTEVNCWRTTIFGIFNNVKAQVVGSSLAGNSIVSALHVPLRLLQNTHHLDDLLRFVQVSENLAIVHLGLHYADPLIVSRFFRAIGMSRNAKSLILGGLQSQHFEAFASLLGSRFTSVDQLELGEMRFESIVTTEHCANIIATNNTLKCLKIHYCGSSMELRWYTNFLERLVYHPTLEKLSISNSRHAPTSVAQTLIPLQKLPSQLKTLELINFAFSAEHGFRPISAGLRSSRAIHSLILSRCTFSDQVAAEDFERIFQPGDTGGCAIRSLQIGGGEGGGVGRTACVVYPEGRGLLSRVLTCCSKESASMPQLEEISIFENQECGFESERYGFNPFFGSLGENAVYVKLRKLHLSQIDGVGLRALTLALPKLVHLKYISISMLTNCSLAEKDDFIRGLRKNGSLEHMSVASSSLTNTQRSKVELICYRNGTLPKVLTKPVLKDNIDDSGRTPVTAFPKLIHVAQECPGMGPTWILAGLLSLESEI